ncbi:S-adenosylmethionine sensor upstream of TORC1 isoform X1 [Rhipicephalus microplus]|uniref:S-adenosylmethionine sensor upstream of TORC1 isoform X1 n=2 Tax=Rhipicephalus microplus TaxID=6941 RepID=UPI003F6D28F3
MTREEHQELVAVIRGVHEKLRLDYQTNGDGDQVWRDHCEDVETRNKYAESMLQLATTIWPCKDRIEWCHDTMREYFFGGGLERSLQRHYRKMGLQYPESIIKQARQNLGLVEEKVCLLDVGSCYNPFSAYTDINAVAIDLTPATEDVIECDFLKLNIMPGGAENLAGSLETPLKALRESSFQVVVFCLVLEYLPSCTQRWSFCRKAASLLKPNGLLFIVTPDSKHQQRNAAMIASWRKALEHIGLLRVRYEKRQHLHCMAFRKQLHRTDETFNPRIAEHGKTVTKELYCDGEKCSNNLGNIKYSSDNPMVGSERHFVIQVISVASDSIGRPAKHRNRISGIECEKERAECSCSKSTEFITSTLETISKHTGKKSRKPGLLTTIPLASSIGKRCQSDALDEVGESLADSAKLQTNSICRSDIEADNDSVAQLMYIPQDSRDYVALFTRNPVEERTSDEDVSLKDGFLELPDLDYA